MKTLDPEGYRSTTPLLYRRCISVNIPTELQRLPPLQAEQKKFIFYTFFTTYLGFTSTVDLIEANPLR
jgi:hypothetical protein